MARGEEMNEILNLVWHHYVCRRCEFIITWNVAVLLTMTVLMKIEWWYHLSRSFLPLKWFVVKKWTRFKTWFGTIKSVEDVSSLSPAMSPFYWQWRWYWKWTDDIISVDRFCLWNGSWCGNERNLKLGLASSCQ